ncbi:transcriptional regulator [Sphingomonas sp. 1185]|uniref:transcriptional regulator n=1 Tax=Sphingomonas sp. 1185 TaxID=3156411 RepID=UPI0033973290
MPMRAHRRIGFADRLAEMKLLSGWCIERRRQQLHVAQERLADDTRITSRWIREIESGNPRTTLDDHLKCAAALDLPVGCVAIPLLFLERSLRFPRELILTETETLEDRCINAVSDQILGQLRRTLGRDLAAHEASD